MSRSGYSDDCEYLDLWRANVARTIKSKRGQTFLRELVQALEAMPEKSLIQDSLKAGEQVCALGAVGLKRGMDMENLDPSEPEEVGKAFGISSMLAQEIVFQNDEMGYPQSPEDRWRRMHKWATERLPAEQLPAKEVK